MKSNKGLIIVFIVVIFGFLILYPVSVVLINKGIIKPNLSNFYEPVTGTGIIGQYNAKTKNIKSNINTKLTNYLFGYSEINQAYVNLKNIFNVSYLDNFKAMGTNSDGEYIFKNTDKDYYVLLTDKNSIFIEDGIKKTSEFYNKLSKYANLYIYLPSRYEYYDFNTISLLDMKSYKDKFINSLDSSIKVDELKINNEEEYTKLFYKTDHHWNAYGALAGYKDIANMMGIDSYDLTASVSDTKYRGSIAKATLDANTYDYFTYINIPLRVDALVDGTTNSKFKPMVIKDTKNIYYDYYVGYYDGLFSEVKYQFGCACGNNNLLIIGDSYSWMIDYIIANNFDYTYVLNPKLAKKMDMVKYIQDNNIKTILVLNETQTTVFDGFEYDYATRWVIN